MNKEFVPYEEALELKQLGFGEECFKFWNCSYFTGDITKKLSIFKNEHIGSTPAPLYQQAFRWFREKYGLYGIISKNGYMIEGEINGDFLRITKFSLKSHEEAELDCLRKLIELVKNKK